MTGPTFHPHALHVWHVCFLVCTLQIKLWAKYLMTDLSFIRLDRHDWKQDKGIQLFNLVSTYTMDRYGQRAGGIQNVGQNWA